MFLTRSNVFHYLVDNKFADGNTLITGSLVVRTRTRRNTNFHVKTTGAEYLVKQAKTWEFQARNSIEREAAFYRHSKHNAASACLLPKCYSYDPRNSVLIFQFLPQHRELHAIPDRFSPEHAQLCGQTMAAFHLAMQSGLWKSEFPAGIASYLSLHETPQDLVTLSAAQRECLRVLAKYKDFGQALNRLRSEWKADTLVHYDWKLENCLISEDRTNLRIIDWEFAAGGDSIWDVATVLQSYWNFWVRSPQQYPIETIRPALLAFLNAYAQVRGHHPPDLALRAVRFAAARMLQSVFETLENSDTMTAPAVRLLQGSLNLFTHPEAAAEQLIGPSQNVVPISLAPANDNENCLSHSAYSPYTPLEPRQSLSGVYPAQPVLNGAESTRNNSCSPTPASSSSCHFEELVSILSADLPHQDDEFKLANLLYNRCYTHSILDATSQPPDPVPGQNFPGDDMTPILSAANHGRMAWDEGWRIDQLLENGKILARKNGAARSFLPGEYLTRQGLGAGPKPDAPVSIFLPSESIEDSPGFYHAYGNTAGNFNTGERTLRFYWNITAEGAPKLLAALTRDFNRFQVPFHYKTANRTAFYSRRDPAVLYIHACYYSITSQLLERLHAEMKPWMKSGVPLFARKLEAGLGFAEDPGESFGQHRSRILARAMLLSHGQQIEERLNEVRRQFKLHGLSLDQSWLNAGSKDLYEFPVPVK